jgi:hypothetical protein
MASVVVEIPARALTAAAWDAVREIGALHTRLVAGFGAATELDAGRRRVTFANGLKVFEPIISLSDDMCRLVWTAVGGNDAVRRFNSSDVSVRDRRQPARRDGRRTGDEAAAAVGAMLAALDRLARVPGGWSRPLRAIADDCAREFRAPTGAPW